MDSAAVGEAAAGKDVHEQGSRCVCAKTRQPADVRQLHEPEATGRDRERGDQSSEREDAEHLRPRHLLFRDADVAMGQQQDEVEGEVAHDGRDGEGQPPRRHEIDRLAAEPNRRLSPVIDGRLAEDPPDGGGRAA